MDIERQVRSSPAATSWDEKHLNSTFKWMQVVFRFLAVLFEVATLAFLGYIYDGWRKEPSVRVDVVFPSFFPVGRLLVRVVVRYSVKDSVGSDFVPGHRRISCRHIRAPFSPALEAQMAHKPLRGGMRRCGDGRQHLLFPDSGYDGL